MYRAKFRDRIPSSASRSATIAISLVIFYFINSSEYTLRLASRRQGLSAPAHRMGRDD